MNIKPIDMNMLSFWITMFQMGGILPISELCILMRNQLTKKKWESDLKRPYYVGREKRILIWGLYEFTLEESIKFRSCISMGKWAL